MHCTWQANGVSTVVFVMVQCLWMCLVLTWRHRGRILSQPPTSQAVNATPLCLMVSTACQHAPHAVAVHESMPCTSQQAGERTIETYCRYGRYHFAQLQHVQHCGPARGIETQEQAALFISAAKECSQRAGYDAVGCHAASRRTLGCKLICMRVGCGTAR